MNQPRAGSFLSHLLVVLSGRVGTSLTFLFKLWKEWAREGLGPRWQTSTVGDRRGLRGARGGECIVSGSSCSKRPRSNPQPCAVCLIRKLFWPSQLKVPALASLLPSPALKRWTLAAFAAFSLATPSGSMPQSPSLSMGLCFQSWLNKAQRSPSWAESAILIFPWGLGAGLLFGCHSAFELLWLRLLSGSASCQEVDLPDLLLLSLQDDERLNLHSSLSRSRQTPLPATSCSLFRKKVRAS